MVIRNLETCPRCGKANPWRKYTSRVVQGERVVYVLCRGCGKREKVVYRKNAESVPESGTK